MRHLPLAILSCTLVSLAVAQKPSRPAPATTADGREAALPVTHVSLYKNGVGFFEHTGHVSGDAQVTIDFTSSQLNDVLQSLTAIDRNGGRVSGAGYNSTTPLAQQLLTLPLTLDANPTVASVYSSIRGARIEVRNGASVISGRLLSVEAGDTPIKPDEKDDEPRKLLLTVASESGEVRTLPITTTTTVRLLDPGLSGDLTRYLKLLDSNRSQGLRHLTLEDRGTGQRELRVSYISEVPIWKSTYRILFSNESATGPFVSGAKPATLQGWSVVDNTTGADWINVHLSLIAGAPQSFIQPLSQPIYSHRPEVAIAQEAQLTPQTFESGDFARMPGSGLAGTVVDPAGAVIANATVIATNMTTGARETRRADAGGQFHMDLPSGQYKLEVSSPGFQHLVENNVSVDGRNIAALNLKLPIGSVNQTVEVAADSVMVNSESASLSQLSNGLSVRNSYTSPAAKSRGFVANAPPPPPPPSYEQLASASFQSNTQSNAFDDFFAYNLTDPVTIRKNESALVPILQAKVAAERVTLVRSDGNFIAQPLRALWLTNTSDLTLDRGSFTVVEDGNFGGEGLLDPIHAGEKRLLSYAADQAVHVSREGFIDTNRVVRITAAKGILHIERAEHTEVTYAVRNAAAEHRTVVLEHPIRPGYTLDSATRPDETTSSVYRFRIDAPAGQTARLRVAANHAGSNQYILTSSDDNQFAYFVQQSGDNATLKAALQPILEARARVAAADAAVDQTRTRLDNLHTDEDRQRANIVALRESDKTARDRFVNDLNKTEDAIVRTQKELDTKTAELESLQDELGNKIQSLDLNLPI